MILYDFRCPIDELSLEAEDVPLYYKGQLPPGSCPVGKHLHAKVDQTLTCTGGHVWNIEGTLLMSREA